MKQTCEACGKVYVAKTKRSRFCSRPDCLRDRNRDRNRDRKRTSRSSAPNNVVALPTPPPPPGDGGRDSDEGSPLGPVATATLAELILAGKENTSIGRAALVLAHQLDYGVKDTGSSKAAVARQHQALMSDVLSGLEKNDNPLDELRARRRHRRGA